MPLFKLGEDAKKNFMKIELVIQRLMRRAGPRVATAIIPPVPIFSTGYHAGNGEVFRAVMPCKGEIKTVAIGAELASGVGETRFRIITSGEIRSEGLEFKVNGVAIEQVHIKVDAGDLVKLVVLNPNEVNDVVASALFVSLPEEAEVTHHLIDAIDKLEEDNNEGVQ